MAPSARCSSKDATKKQIRAAGGKSSTCSKSLRVMVQQISFGTYGLITYQTAYLKANYTVEFWRRLFQ